jgi:hypothetical protein
MNLKTVWQEFGLTLALIIIITFFLPPIQSWWMTSGFMPSVLFLLAIVFIGFSIFVWKERAYDERELIHRNFASRLGYLAGSSVLVVGIIVETLKHRFDPWLVLTLLVMIAAKLATRVYAAMKQ